MLRTIEEKRQEGNPTPHARDANKKELGFIERYKEIKEKRDKQ